MSRPSLFAWLFRWTIGSIACLGVLLAVLVVVNVVDYAPYGLALQRVHRLKPAAVASLAAACTRYEKAGYRNVTGSAIPKEFRALKPLRISFWPGSTDVTLLEAGNEATIEELRHHRYILLRISTTPSNQVVSLDSYVGRYQGSRILWEKHPDVSKRLKPTGRIVTVLESGRDGANEWIVLRDDVLVIERTSAVGEGDQIVERVPLAPEQRDQIEAACREIGPQIRGHAFDAGAIDGIGLHLSFTGDGARDDQDVVLSNTCRPEVEPLLRAISHAVRKEHAITFADDIRRTDADFPGAPQMVMTLGDFERRVNPVLLPWWCWWPRLMGPGI